MKSLFTRAISAAVAIVLVYFLQMHFGKNGYRLLCFLGVVLGTRELIRIIFKPDDSLIFKGIFYFLMTLLFSWSVYSVQNSAIIFSFVSIVFFSLSLLKLKKFEDLRALSEFQAKSILGFLYLGLLPAFACKILDLPHGIEWFLFLLCVVLLGDIMAYLIGVLFGKKKILPEISPKKTYAGSCGGFFGSSLAATAFSVFIFHDTSFLWILLLANLSGFFAQMGDFFESLLKRVADKKDSGSLMPGHGGILDRIDGILFAAPIVYFAASWIEKVL